MMGTELPLKALARMKAAHLKVMLALYAHQSYRRGSATPALRWIAGYSRLSLSTVQSAVQEMKSLGYLAIDRASGGRCFQYRMAADLAVEEPVDNVLLQRSASRTQSPPHRTQSPAGRTEREKERIQSVSSTESNAPRAREDRPPDDENDDARDLSARSARPGGFVQGGLLLPIGGTPPPDDGRVRQLKRERWEAKLGRYAVARFAQPELGAILSALWGVAGEEERRRTLERLDTAMRREGWDDRPRAAAGGRR